MTMSASAASPSHTLTLVPEPPMLDTTSPRVQAAMRVLGILPQELDKKELEEYGGIEPRYELFENKRRILLSQVGELASKGEEDTQVITTEDTQRSRNAAFMAAVLETEKRNMDKMAKKARQDVQKVVLEELETKLVLHNAGKKLEENEQRVKILKKGRDEKLAALKREAEKRAEKNAEVRRRAEQHLEEEAAELGSRLAANDARTRRKLDEIFAGQEDARSRGMQRQQDINDRNARLEQQFQRQREKQYDSIVAKSESKYAKMQETLAAKQTSNDAWNKRHEESMERVRQHWEKRQQDADEKYAQAMRRHEAAKEKRESDLSQQVKDYSGKNTKERTGFLTRWERMQKESDRDAKELLEKLTASPEGRGFDRSLSEPQLAALRMRGHHTELVAANRARLQRSHHYAQEQALSKIEAMRQRVEFLQNSKETADRRRTVMIKNCAVEKFHLNHEVDKVKSSPAEKMVNIVREMQPDPEAATRIREIMTVLGLEKMIQVEEEKQ